MVTRFGVGAAFGDTLQEERWSQLPEQGAFQGRRQIQRLGLVLHGHEVEGDGGEERDGQALASARRPIGDVGKRLQPRPHVGKALRNVLRKLHLSLLQVIGVMEGSPFTHQFTARNWHIIRTPAPPCSVTSRCATTTRWFSRRTPSGVSTKAAGTMPAGSACSSPAASCAPRRARRPRGPTVVPAPTVRRHPCAVAPAPSTSVLHDHPRAACRVAPDGIDLRVCVTVEPGRTFDHVPLPAVGLHFQGYPISRVLPLPRRRLTRPYTWSWPDS